MKTKIKTKMIVEEVNGLHIGDEVPALDYGRIESFFEEDGVWMASVRDDRGASCLTVEELKELI